MYKGWTKNLQLYVYIQKRYRKGFLKTHKCGKWDFLPNGWKKTVRICPIKNKWHYSFQTPVQKWKQKIKVLVIDNKPFKLKKERFGNWRGAKTGRTKAVPMDVWQENGSNKILVGHLGLYSLAMVRNGKLMAMTNQPIQGQQYFIGRGTLEAHKFKTLKTVDPLKRIIHKRNYTTKQLYAIPKRHELGGRE